MAESSGREGSQYTVESLLQRLRHPGTPIIVVEGLSDKQAIDRLLIKLGIHSPQFMVIVANQVKVDGLGCRCSSVSLVCGSSESQGKRLLGCRCRIVSLCQRIEADAVADRFVGLVDRDFDGFCCDGCIADDYGCHRVVGRLVMTRGHSIENYWFDENVFPRLMDSLSNNTPPDQAAAAVRDVLESSIRLGAALTLACRDSGGHYETVRSRLRNSRVRFSVQFGQVTIDETQWLERSEDPALMAQVWNRHQYWLEQLVDADPGVLRWFCHGKIGLAVIMRAIERVVTIYEPGHILTTEAARIWGEAVAVGQAEGPRVILDLLRLPCHASAICEM